MRETAVRLDERLPFADAVVVGHDHGNLGSQADGLVDVGVVIVAVVFRIIKRKGRNYGPQNVHGQCMLGRELQELDDGGIQLAFFH